MSKVACNTIAFLLLACNLSQAQPAPTLLARMDVELPGVGIPGVLTSAAFHFRVFRYPDEFPSGEWIVGPLTAADAGRTFLANPSTVSQYFRLEFQPIADLLTDGDRNGVIEVTLGPFPEGGGSIGAFKQTVFQNFVPEIHTEVFVPLLSGIDLSGYQIEALAMTIRDLRIVYDASTNITSIRGAYSIDILGRPVEGIVVDVDIRPTSSTNPVQPGEQGVLPVAILTTDTFDATTVDVSSVCFGDAEAPGERACMEVHGTGHSEDVDGDGHLDLVLHFKTQETGIDSGDTTACLTGRTQTGGPIRGCDSLRTVWSRTSWTSF